MTGLDLVAPTDDRAAVARALAPRVARLDGLRLGLLDNRKGNADLLLARVAERLAPEGVGVSLRLEKRIFSRPATPEQVRRIAEHSDAVVLALGD